MTMTMTKRALALALAGALACASLAAHGADPTPQHATLTFDTYDGKAESARFSTPDAALAQRSYVQSTTMKLRDPGPQTVEYRERAELPTVRSGNVAFDALFALALTEMTQNSVSQIKDDSYNGGAAIACDCFETGEKWHYVWTRDLSYAADLGLALLDPVRVKNSLEFKLSPFRAGVTKAAPVAGSADGLQIVQDTGSGGSWPVSTDRVSWAFGAEHALRTLAPEVRKPFARRALAALINTVENDRVAAYDGATGLYTGEQSFLDWREQSYAAWIVDDLASMASSKALSTNVAHYKALTLSASLAAEHGDRRRAERYRDWAAELKRAINARLWLDDAQMYSSLTAGHFDGAPMHKFDWLGQALAIVTGVADPARAKAILAHYPHGPMGAPVIHPQQFDVPVYHNRAMWPFVTAYGLKAAAMTGDVSVADAAYGTLMRGAALNLSNMENLEWLSGQPLLTDPVKPALNGPVISSRRQLWSVGAYLGMVIGNVFGVSATADGLQVRPFITARLRRDTFGDASQIVLDNLTVHGKRVTLRIALPPVLPPASSASGYHPVSSVTVNGVAAQPSIRLAADSVIEVRLGALVAGEQSITRVTADPYGASSAVYGPREPKIAALARTSAGVALTIAAAADPAGVVYNIYRDGVAVARKLDATTWTDRSGGATACYTVQAQFADSGNRSHHSAPRCLDSGMFVSAPRQGWGKPQDVYAVDAIKVAQPGRYQVQIRYRNSANEINLGISGGVKWLTVRDAAGKTVAAKVVQLPHARTGAGIPGAFSTPVAAHLKAGVYRVALSDFYNMSYLHSNSTFGAAGGSAGSSNRFDIEGVRLLRTR